MGRDPVYRSARGAGVLFVFILSGVGGRRCSKIPSVLVFSFRIDGVRKPGLIARYIEFLGSGAWCTMGSSNVRFHSAVC